MAEVRKVVVEVLNGSGDDAPAPNDLNGKITQARKPSSSPEKVLNIEGLKQGAVNVARQVGHLAEGFAEQELNRYFSLSEDYLGENTYNQVKGYFGAAKNIISGLKSGAKTGAAIGGPIGALVGGVVGGVMSSANLAVQHRQKMAGFYKQLNETNIQTSFGASRMNLVDGGQNTIN